MDIVKVVNSMVKRAAFNNGYAPAAYPGQPGSYQQPRVPAPAPSMVAGRRGMPAPVRTPGGYNPRANNPLVATNTQKPAAQPRPSWTDRFWNFIGRKTNPVITGQPNQPQKPQQPQTPTMGSWRNGGF